MKHEIQNPARLSSPKSKLETGFTLLEVLLSLSLSVVVLAGIGAAIHIHLHSVDSGRNHVEQAQLARAILARIAEDLRASIQYEKPDTSGLQVAASNNPDAVAGALGAETRGGGSTSQSNTNSSSSSSQSGSSIADSAAVPTTPGVYGSQYEIQMDVSRLPRPDQYVPSTGAASAGASLPPSDVKTVAYYLRAEGDGGPAGLVRREVDRAATLYAAEQGTLTDLDVQAEMLASEVTDIEFVYYDGTDTFTDWDSSEQKSLPLAVEVSITLSTATADPTLSFPDEGMTYRLLVCVPAAHKSDSQSSSGDSSSSSSPSSSSSSPATP